jgi:hypothetical protein
MISDRRLDFSKFYSKKKKKNNENNDILYFFESFILDDKNDNEFSNFILFPFM